ncbi:MAG: sugar nucleotide-binding protein, partial [Planctomycetes bacterium]|nr:sugar nucleotide-binding protein [Planctomycetota bacterium]
SDSPILLAGIAGQVGWELRRTLSVLGPVVAPSLEEMNFLDADSIRACIRRVKPALIVNAAAYTNVDKAEEEKDAAWAINAKAPGILGEEAVRAGIGVIHYSTDYVFDGRKKEGFREEDEPNPLNVYGRSKLQGERNLADSGAAYLTFRCAWIYGNRFSNILNTILRLASSRDEIAFVRDQTGCPTWSRTIRPRCWRACERKIVSQQVLRTWPGFTTSAPMIARLGMDSHQRRCR